MELMQETAKKGIRPNIKFTHTGRGTGTVLPLLQ